MEPLGPPRAGIKTGQNRLQAAVWGFLFSDVPLELKFFL